MTRALAVAALLLAMAATFAAGAAQARESVVTIPTRDDVTVSYILDAPDDAPKKAVAISFIGGFGQMHLDKHELPLKFPKVMNALLRIRHQLAGPDIADVIVDAPSDHQLGGTEDYFRGSADHAADIRAVIADVKKRFPDARIFLICTSRGTISAANLGVSLHDLVAGTILTSTVTHWDKMGTALSRFDFDTLKVPTLFIHHVNDGCATSPYAGVQALAGKFPVVSASGGDPPESGPCDPLAPHGFWGLDAQVVAVMQDFMLSKPYPRSIP